jgi:L-iditol 2-dehydrogenase
MKAAILKKVGEIQIEDLPVPNPGPAEVLVKIKSVGICGSDLHYYTHGKIGAYIVEKPIILGHEASGEVVAVGKDVTRLKVGDRVAVEPGIPCRKCEFCKTGRYNLCPDVAFMATPPYDGAFTEYIVSPEDFTFKIPDTMSYNEAALMEPLAVGVYAAERAMVKPGMTAAVLGLGPIGMVVAQAAKAYGASRVVGTDVVDYRLNQAESFAVDKALHAKNEALEDQIGADLGGRPDIVFETSGNGGSIALTTSLVKTGGTVVMIGMSPEDFIPINHGQISGKELTVLGIFRYANMYPKAIELVKSGVIDVKSLVTKVFNLEQTQAALDYAIGHKNDSIKVMIHPE